MKSQRAFGQNADRRRRTLTSIDPRFDDPVTIIA
jgi:hypothetical protein